MSGGEVDSIRYIIYVNPARYAELDPINGKRTVGRVVGKLNEYFRNSQEKIMAVGPGRWGSNNIDLGVNVNYSDIDNFTVLVEFSQTGNEPELSYGTHFFQDLVEADIIYMPVFPDQPAAEFNSEFFAGAPNILGRILPEHADFEEYIQVIDVPAADKGAYAHVAADAQTRKAVCYLKQQR
jgi:hypothetical protein